MKRIIILFNILFCATVFSQNHFIDAQFLQTYPANQLQFRPNDVDVYKIRYKTQDIHGNLDTASGAIAIPDIACDSFPIINYSHGTQFEKLDVPSRLVEIDFGLLAAANGGIATMADYLGHGDSRGIHPYLHAQSEATASIDFIRACREYLATQNISLNGEVFLTGYSQGGHVCMAIHKYIEDNNLLNEFNVVASLPQSGPYDISVTTADSIFADTMYTVPGFIPYLINSMDMAYNLYDSLPQYYKSPYDDAIEDYLNGTITGAALNSTLPSNINKLIQDSVLNGFRNVPNHPLRIALEDQDLYNWTPTRQIKMGYCEADHLVTYQNSIKTLNTMTANGSTVVSATSAGATNNHFTCAQPALQSAGLWIIANATACVATSSILSITQEKNIVNIYPNPINQNQNLVVETSTDNIKHIEVLDIMGRIYQNQNPNANRTELNMIDFPKQMYIMNIQLENGGFIQKKFIVN